VAKLAAAAEELKQAEEKVRLEREQLAAKEAKQAAKAAAVKPKGGKAKEEEPKPANPTPVIPEEPVRSDTTITVGVKGSPSDYSAQAQRDMEASDVSYVNASSVDGSSASEPNWTVRHARHTIACFVRPVSTKQGSASGVTIGAPLFIEVRDVGIQWVNVPCALLMTEFTPYRYIPLWSGRALY